MVRTVVAMLVSVLVGAAAIALLPRPVETAEVLVEIPRAVADQDNDNTFETAEDYERRRDGYLSAVVSGENIARAIRHAPALADLPVWRDALDRKDWIAQRAKTVALGEAGVGQILLDCRDGSRLSARHFETDRWRHGRQSA